MKHLYFYKIIKLCSVFICLLSYSGSKAVTFIVDNTADTDDLLAYTAGNGTNTLRKCIRLANANVNTPIVDIINFNGLTGGGPYTIALGSNLPFLTDPVRLDGFTAGGAVVPTPIVVIKGSGGGPSPINNVFNLTAGGSNSIIRGFVLYKTLNDAVYNNGATNLIIEGCWIGILETGAAALTNNQVKGHGIYLTGAANNTVIGTTTARNVISANVGHGIVVVGCSGVTIKNNYIGTNTTGTAALANGIHGINLDNSSATTIGGAAANEGNLISGNSQMGITVVNLSNNPVIKGNKIGTNLAGTAAIANTVHGINIDNSAGAIIGGGLSGEGNLISGNTQTGIVLTNASSNALIKGNKIGTDLAGTAAIANGVHGISIYTNVLATTIGGAVAGEGNLISGNGQNGIDNTGSSHNTIIQGNYIGTNTAGTAAIANGTHGIFLNNSNGITIGGNTKLKRNVISGNGNAAGENGIGILDCNTLTIQGNFIGVSSTGLAALANYDSGLSFTNSNGNIVGGTAYMERNVISGQNGPGSQYGIYAYNVDNTNFRGNYIGTDSTGNAALPNRVHGVHQDGIAANGGCSDNNWISNVVSGNLNIGLDMLATVNNTFYGNYIGLGINGTTDLGNGTIGLRIGKSFDYSQASTGNIVGGTMAGQRNYISGNGDHGILLDGQTINTVVKNNLVGSDITGMVAVSNNGIGILLLDEANNTTIGGTAANEGNLFCCSATSDGIRTQITNNTTIYGNLIGVNITGAIAAGFGNAEDGVTMGSYWNLGSTNNSNIVGGLAAGAQNIIANNGRDGVHLVVWGGSNGTNFNPIIGNSIYCNGGLGINMENNAANENQGVPAPVVTSSLANSISGTGVAGYTIHVYRNQYTDGARCDCEGEIYVGTTTVTGGGTWTLTHSLALTAAQAASVTATQTNATNSTSEFWVCTQPLPVDLLSLEAKKNNNSVSVNFSVANENNIAVYHILRSSDGIHFEMIGSVYPLNIESQITAYSFEDPNPLNGLSYYRIQTVERDGQTAHSKIVHTNTTSATYLFPNPTTDAVNIVASGIMTRIEIYNAVGQSILEQNTEATEITVPLSHLSAGIYYAKVFEGEKTEVFKLEKK